MKRCKDCKYKFTGTYISEGCAAKMLRWCLDKYDSDPDKCPSYARKFWKIWRSK